MDSLGVYPENGCLFDEHQMLEVHRDVSRVLVGKTKTANVTSLWRSARLSFTFVAMNPLLNSPSSSIQRDGRLLS
ncbi:MAG TPA: hypothetical protein DCE44_23980 [Verrucomicrobiales bacterium]|nr:hypothetical protein [Verrucomicrobiales bacterium]